MKIHERAQDLWPELIKQAGLDVADRAPRWWRRDEEPDTYDAGLLEELHGKLVPGSKLPFLASLKAANPPISAEKLLRYFFQAVQPFTMMKLDILEMMSAACARKGDDNTKVRFQLNESDAPLDLLLNQFREQMEFIEKQITTVHVRTWHISDLWKIEQIAKDDLPKDFGFDTLSPANTVIAQWSELSHSRFQIFPDVWRTGVDELDRRLQVVVGLIDEVSTAFLRYGGDYTSARRRMQDLEGEGKAGSLIDPIGFPLQELYILESDYWLSAIGKWLLAVRLAAAKADSAAMVGKIISGLDQIIPGITSSVREREEIVSKLTDILNLPIWKQRHAVYAVWVGSQIWQSLKQDWQFRFHLDQDVLSFAFSGVHLATLIDPGTDQILSWWTELRTPAKNLPSGHRSSAIQPDYRIRRAPFTAADSDVLIVEVKQYKRSSTKNFSAALMDYAFACEKAAVMLASYGPILPQVLAAVPEEYRARTQTAAFVRPDRKEVCGAFQNDIRRLVPSTDFKRSKPVEVESVERIDLSWGPHPRDLDLHVYSDKAAAQKFHVHYATPRFESFIHLLNDHTNGYGPEMLLFNHATGKHVVCVHQYSDDGSLATSEAKVTIFADIGGTKKVLEFESPKSGVGRWWIVCGLDFSTGTIEAIDRLVEDPDLP